MKSVYLKIVLLAISFNLLCPVYAADTWYRKIENRTQLPLDLNFVVDGPCSDPPNNAVYFGDPDNKAISGAVPGNNANFVLNKQYSTLNMTYVRYCGNIEGHVLFPNPSDASHPYGWGTYNADLHGDWVDYYRNEGTTDAQHWVLYRAVNNPQVAGTDGDYGNIRLCYPAGELLSDGTYIPANCSDESKLPSDNMTCDIDIDDKGNKFVFKHAFGAPTVTSSFGTTYYFTSDANGYVDWASSGYADSAGGDHPDADPWYIKRGVDNTTWTIKSGTVYAENVVCTQQ